MHPVFSLCGQMESENISRLQKYSLTPFFCRLGTNSIPSFRIAANHLAIVGFSASFSSRSRELEKYTLTSHFPFAGTPFATRASRRSRAIACPQAERASPEWRSHNEI